MRESLYIPRKWGRSNSRKQVGKPGHYAGIVENYELCPVPTDKVNGVRLLDLDGRESIERCREGSMARTREYNLSY